MDGMRKKELIDRIHDTVSAAVDFVLDILELSPVEAKMVSVQDIKAQVPIENQKDGMKYVLILWNDETHSFEEVIDEVMEATGCSREKAQEIAVNVDSEGRQAIKTSDELQRLVEIGNTIELSRLALSVVDERQALNENIAALVIKWLKMLSSSFLSPLEVQGTLYEPLNASLRHAIAKVFFAPRQHVRRTILSFPPPKRDSFEDYIFSCITKKQLVEVSHSMIAESRLHYFLHYDVRLWKMPRTELKELLISSMISFNETYKRQLGVIFGYHYITLARIYMLHDREHDRSILNLSVQLFTVPSVAQTLVSSTNLVPAIFALLKAIFLSDALPQSYRILKDFNTAYSQALKDIRVIFPPMTCTSDICHNKRLWHFFQDVKYLMASEAVQRGLFRSDIRNLQSFLDLLRVWEGKHLQERSVTRHVEYESEAWIHAFNSGLYSFRLLKQVGECFLPSGDWEPGLAQMVEALKVTIQELTLWCVADSARNPNPTPKANSDEFFYTLNSGGKQITLPDFVVSQRTVSMHYDLHWFFAEIIAKVPFLFQQIEDPDMASRFWNLVFTDESVTIPTDRMVGLEINNQFMDKLDIQKLITLLFDYPLRSIVFVSQIKADLWVRNGASMRTQALHFRDVSLRECYDDNLFLLQTASSIMEPDVFLLLLIERFELQTWLGWSKGFTNLNLDADHLPRVAECLLEVLIYILSERSRALGIPLELEAKREVIHHLGSSKGIAYSSLVRLLPDEISEISFVSDGQTKTFDDVLKAVSNFRSPDGLQDKGLFELKGQFYSELDPWFWHLSRTERTCLEGILKEKAKTPKEQIRVPKIQPFPRSSPFRSLVRILNEPLFMRITFYSLWRSTKSEGDSGQPSVSNDILLSGSLQILMIGIAQYSLSSDTLRPFLYSISRVRFSVPTDKGLGVEEKTILDLVCSLLDRGSDADIKDYVPRLKYILHVLEESEDPIAIEIIRKNNKLAQKDIDIMALDSADPSQDEKQKRKLAAKARQAAILAQMAQAQKTFIENQGDWDEELQDGGEDAFHTPLEKRPDERIVDFPAGSCIFCQEDASIQDQRVYGVLGFIQMSNMEKFIRMDGTFSITSTFQEGMTWDQEHTRTKENFDFEPCLGSVEHRSGVHASSCGHIMHVACYESYCTSIRARHMLQPTRNHPEDTSKGEFLCPLCRTLSNILFPIGSRSHSHFVNWSGFSPLHSGDTLIESVDNGLETIEDWWTQSMEPKVKSMLFSEVEFESSSLTPDHLESSTGTTLASGVQSFLSNLWMLRPPGDVPEQKAVDLQQAFEDHILSTYSNMRNLPAEDLDDSELATRELEDLWSLVSYTLESLEIQLRGTGAFSTSSHGLLRIGILDSLTPQLSSFLPILSSSILTYQRSVLANQEIMATVSEHLQDLLTSFFSDEYEDGGKIDFSPFGLLVRLCGMIHAPLKGSVNDFLMWTRLCWIICILQSLNSILDSTGEPEGHGIFYYSSDLQAVLLSLGLALHGSLSEPEILAFVSSQCLIFVRRAILFSFAYCGMVPPTGSLGFAYEEELVGGSLLDTRESDDELSRLVRYLNLPSLRSIISANGARLLERTFYQRLSRTFKRKKDSKSFLPLPGIYELVSLPHRYDTLFEKSLQFSCLKCSSTPSMPAMCLVCGTIVCSQSYCCAVNGVGECNQHVERCSKEIGLFLQIKQGVIVLLHGKKGYFMNAPYLDSHGEPDHGLKRGKPLFLNQKRYDEIRRTWLTHGIPSLIGRKMEQTFDFGGWVTL